MTVGVAIGWHRDKPQSNSTGLRTASSVSGGRSAKMEALLVAAPGLIYMMSDESRRCLAS
jgi:hypothetical protein